jgi:hypothetical protein
MSGLEAFLPPGKGILPYYMLIVSLQQRHCNGTSSI